MKDTNINMLLTKGIIDFYMTGKTLTSRCEGLSFGLAAVLRA